ncbi:MAG: hypothetical protein ACRDTA_16580 [Pseudonocardiaceae bacterium]
MSAWEAVRYRDLGGVLRKIELEIGNELHLPGAALPARIVTDPANVSMIQKWVPEHVGERDACSYDLLDAEIRASTRLGQMYGGSGNPGRLAAAVGYNVDVAEPFVLLEPYCGVPLVFRRLELDELREFAISLLWTLQQTAAAGVVHGAVRLASLRWDSQARTLQLVDFERALRQGDPRRPVSTIYGLSREQVEGAGQADVRDDMWGAGMVIRQLSVGPYTNGSENLPTQVQVLLQGVFADTATARPHATDLLARLGIADSVSNARDPDAALAPGRHFFDQIIARKHLVTSPQDHEVLSPGSAASANGARTPMPVVVGVFLLLVVAVVVLLVVFR